MNSDQPESVKQCNEILRLANSGKEDEARELLRKIREEGARRLSEKNPNSRGAIYF